MSHKLKMLSHVSFEFKSHQLIIAEIKSGMILIHFGYFAVWEKLKTQKQGERWIPEQEEEFEDSLGNVVNKKTFEDLKRQGLL